MGPPKIQQVWSKATTKYDIQIVPERLDYLECGDILFQLEVSIKVACCSSTDRSAFQRNFQGS